MIVLIITIIILGKKMEDIDGDEPAVLGQGSELSEQYPEQVVIEALPTDSSKME